MNKTFNTFSDIAVIGGGAAGLMCASVSSRIGAKITVFEKNTSKVRLSKDNYFDKEFIDMSHISGEGHSGGDERLTEDFINFQRGESHSISCTSIYDSVPGHKVIFLADESREKGGELVHINL